MTREKSLIESLKDKRVRHGGYAAIISAGVLVGLVVLNLIVGQLSVEIDMTESKLFSLTDETKQLLDSLDHKVDIYGIYRIGEESGEVAEILTLYDKQSEMVTLEYVDIEKNPGFTARFEKEKEKIRNNSVIVESGENYRVYTPYDLYDLSQTQTGQSQLLGITVEQRITSAIQYVTSGYEPVIYQLLGHNEYTLSDFGLQTSFEKENYQIKELDLLKNPSIPDDAALLLVFSPKQDLNPTEVETIRTYLNEGGRAIFLFDFLSFDFLPGFSELLKSFGVAVEPGLVMESTISNLYTKENPFLITPDLGDHEILSTLREKRMSILLPRCMGIREMEVKKRNLEVEPVVTSSSDSWLRTKDDGTRERLPTDIPGPINLAVSVKDKYEQEEGTRLLVFGTSGILTPVPPIGQIKGNIDFFLDSLAWAVNRADSISIGTKSLFKLPLRMSGLLVFIYSGIVVIIIPLIIIILGLIVWLRRRHL